MSETAQCVRCGRVTSTEFTGFITWRVTHDGRAICPNCLTPRPGRDASCRWWLEGGRRRGRAGERGWSGVAHRAPDSATTATGWVIIGSRVNPTPRGVSVLLPDAFDLDDPLNAVQPGDVDPEPDAPHDCGVVWVDAHDLLAAHDGPVVPWRCTRPAGHPGQHIAAAIGSHVAAVTPPAPSRVFVPDPCGRGDG